MYKATCHGQVTALKVVRHPTAAMAQLETLRVTLMSLQHPNVVRMLWMATVSPHPRRSRSVEITRYASLDHAEGHSAMCSTALTAPPGSWHLFQPALQLSPLSSCCLGHGSMCRSSSDASGSASLVGSVAVPHLEREPSSASLELLPEGVLASPAHASPARGSKAGAGHAATAVPHIHAPAATEDRLKSPSAKGGPMLHSLAVAGDNGTCSTDSSVRDSFDSAAGSACHSLAHDSCGVALLSALSSMSVASLECPSPSQALQLATLLQQRQQGIPANGCAVSVCDSPFAHPPQLEPRSPRHASVEHVPAGAQASSSCSIRGPTPSAPAAAAAAAAALLPVGSIRTRDRLEPELQYQPHFDRNASIASNLAGESVLPLASKAAWGLPQSPSLPPMGLNGHRNSKSALYRTSTAPVSEGGGLQEQVMSPAGGGLVARVVQTAQAVGAEASSESYTLMEYCEKGSLHDAIRCGAFWSLRSGTRRRNWGAIYRCLIDVAAGMGYLHQHGVVHGDLTARNVLLKTQPDDPRHFVCKIADFGFSRLLGPAKLNAASANAQGPSSGSSWSFPSTMGELSTLCVACPKLLSEGVLSFKSDLYSFAMLMWALLAGEMPWAGLSFAGMYARVVYQGQRPTIPPGCPKQYADVMRACWDADPAARPTFEAVHDILVKQLDSMRSRAAEARAAASKASGAAAGGDGEGAAAAGPGASKQDFSAAGNASPAVPQTQGCDPHTAQLPVCPSTLHTLRRLSPLPEPHARYGPVPYSMSEGYGSDSSEGGDAASPFAVAALDSSAPAKLQSASTSSSSVGAPAAQPAPLSEAADRPLPGYTSPGRAATAPPHALSQASLAAFESPDLARQGSGHATGKPPRSPSSPLFPSRSFSGVLHRHQPSPEGSRSRMSLRRALRLRCLTPNAAD